MPDVDVPITPEHEVKGAWPQLDAAIEATLKQLERGSAAGDESGR